jgi:hypothetical protein
MADYDMVTGYAGNYNVTKLNMGRMETLTRYIDCATTGKLPTTGMTSGKTYEIFTVPATWFTVSTTIIMDVGEGADEHATISDGTNTLLSAADVNTADTVETTATGFQAAGAHAHITISPDADLTVAKFWVVIVGMVLDTKM